MAEDLEPMSEVADHNIGAEILLPRGEQMARGQLVVSSYDTVMYQVEYAGGEIKELTANVIVKLMYAQCDVDRN